MTTTNGPAPEQWFELTCTFPEVGEVMVMGALDRETLERLASQYNKTEARTDSPGPWKVRKAPSRPSPPFGAGMAESTYVPFARLHGSHFSLLR